MCPRNSFGLDLCRDATSGLVSFENMHLIRFGTEPSRGSARNKNLASVLAYDEPCVSVSEPSHPRLRSSRFVAAL